MISENLYTIFGQVHAVLNSWTVIIIILSTITWLWWKKPHRRFPPGPRGIPIFGILPFVGQYPERVFKKWSLEQYGDVMSVRLADQDVVVLNTFDTINQALVRQGSVFSGRPSIDLYTQVLHGNGVLFSNFNEKFKTQKKFGLTILKHFGMGRKGMENIINNESEYFVDFLTPKVGKPAYLGASLFLIVKENIKFTSRNDTWFLFQLDFHNLIGNVICKVTFGRRFDYDDPNFRDVFKILKETYSDPRDASRIAVLLHFHKYAKYIPPYRSVNERIVKSEVDMADAFRLLIDQHKETFDGNCIRDFIDAYLYEQTFGEGTKDPAGFTDRQLEVYVRDLFTAGTETSSSTMNWAILCLLHYPEYEKLIIEEIDRILGPDETPTMVKKNDMPFISAFIQEVFRYLPIVPLSVTHLTQDDAELHGYFIPKGTKVIPNIWGAHFDPYTWNNPHKFDPHRHINENGRFVPSVKVISFGIGPRFCLGESIGRSEMFLVLCKILQRFTISGTGEPLPGLKSGMTSIVHTSPKYHVILSIR